VTGAIVAALLDWLPDARRDLPWRRLRTPYTVWVSEIMLQQTQVVAVIPYFERWLGRFPDVSALAATSLHEVLRLWEGLGYYARARNLHRASQQIVERHGGAIPDDRHALLALPGIGRSTAGAILSLAFGHAEPILDGNVRRVLCRIYDVAEDPRRREVEARLWGWAAGLVEAAPTGRAGDLNEALMELGALVCVPGAPACDACPLQARCLGLMRGVATERPARATRRALPHHEVTAGVIREAAGLVLLVQRPAHGLLGGLWGFPGGQAQPDEPLEDALRRNVRAQTGLEVSVGAPLTRIEHAYTHFRITLTAFACVPAAPSPALAADALPAVWVRLASLDDYPLAVTDRRIARFLSPHPTPDDT
jgi:A/G-specific adenine glycosylase